MTWKWKMAAAPLVFSVALTGCSGIAEKNGGEAASPSNAPVVIQEAKAGNALVEDRYLYGKDKGDEVTHLFITVMNRGTDPAKGSLVSFDDINHITERMPEGQSDAELEVLLQEGNEKGPVSGQFGFSTKEANGTLQIRGSSTRSAAQKSYKIKLFDKAGMWREQKVLNLNKHAADLSRVRNKLSFDYFTRIPDFTSLRTHFVHLYVKDLTKSKPTDAFEDYGLYTEIENPGKNYLKQHGFDANGSLYKAINFAFYRSPDELKAATEPGYNKAAFEKILSIEGNSNHEKLLRMLDDVNDYTLNINQVVDKHFNRDNMLTWLAVNILMGNIDTISQNYILYSPLNANTWYFFPWDYDGAWDWYNQPREPTKLSMWQKGIGTYWSNVLFKRFFMDPDNVQALTDKIEKLREIINPDQTRSMLQSYYDTVSRYTSRDPDVIHIPGYLSEFEDELKRLPEVSENNKKTYYDSLENPMPIFLGDPTVKDGSVTYTWDPSYDFQGDDLSYHIQVAADPEFSRILYEKKGISGTTISSEALPSGRYYLRVTVTDSKGHTQIPFDSVEERTGTIHHGMKMFSVP
ncbi:CotH kinase family protein [Gorillibacterium sp. sgz5001074]|uniref:CotH kinase family protein n=1 Tax=Gorillibacterium sp. sgz5001074 TaxID=3446695 RepID=UPI003F66FE23